MPQSAALQDQRYQQDQSRRKPAQDQQVARQPVRVQVKAVESMLHDHDLVIDRKNLGDHLQHREW